MSLFGDSLMLDAAVIVSGLLLLVYLYLQHRFNYWKKRGFPYVQPTMLFGNFKDCLLQKENVGQFLQKVYNKGVGKPFIGFYVFGR
jgi:cytochrome P450 family 6